MKCFFPKIWVKPNVLKNLSVIFEIVAILTHIPRGICSQVPTLSLDKLSFEQEKEMTIDR